MKKTLISAMIIFSLIFFSACLLEDGTDDTSNDDGSSDSADTTALTLDTLAGILLNTTFDTSTESLFKYVTQTTTCSDTSEDHAGNIYGLDCDGNGLEVAYQTPTAYTVALKSVYLITDSDDLIPILEYDLLSSIDADGVFEFTSEESSQTIEIPSDLAASYVTAPAINGIKLEIYYYEFEILMYNEYETIRIYVSDDDFETEGYLGHHQGDVTYFDADGIEHWANGGLNWFSNPDDTLERGEFANGAGETDEETGHERGMFGNLAQWNADDFMQGENQDTFFVEMTFENPNGTNIQINFDITHTMFYEDYINDKSFDPCIENDLGESSEEGCGANWSINPPEIESVVIDEI
ncbi:MAG: hypothetical protein ABIA04_02200 [Pseudomonadota bacterium]